MVLNLSYYEVLGVEPNATAEEIKNAYKKMSLANHPDRNPHGKMLMQHINAARDVLLDESKHSEYDRGSYQSIRQHNLDSTLSSELRRLRSELVSSQRKAAELERQYIDARHSITQLRQHNSVLEKDLSYEKQVRKQLQANQAMLEVQMEVNARKLNIYEDKLERISRERKEEKSVISTLKSEKQEAETAPRAANAQLEKEEKMNALRAANAASQSEIRLLPKTRLMMEEIDRIMKDWRDG